MPARFRENTHARSRESTILGRAWKVSFSCIFEPLIFEPLAFPSDLLRDACWSPGSAGAVRSLDEVRKAAVLHNVKQLAEKARIPVPVMAAIWEMLVETSISYELQKWDQIRK